MKVVPVAAAPVTAPLAGAQTTSSAQARERAIAAVMGQAQSTPVQNASNISPEEMGALSTKQGAPDTSGDEVTQAPAKTEENPLSSQYANLARKEKALRAQISQFKAEQERFKLEQSNVKAPSFDESKYVPRDRIKSEYMEVLAEEGVSYDDIYQRALSQSQIQTDPAVKAAIAELRAETKAAKDAAAATQKAYEDSQKQSYQQALNQIRNEVKQLAYASPEFEMIKATNSTSDVVELIEQTFQKDGVLLTVEEACKSVEEYLLEEATKLSKIKKLQQRLSQPAPAQAGATQAMNQKQPQQTTLSNSMTSTKPMKARERAIAAMEGRLK
jgi:hypothetical protein